MATITKENIGLLHEKLTVKLEKTDYLPSFEKALKEYSKKANIPGFRKGMVPAGLIKKMYGTSLFTDEILKTVDKQLIDYLQNDKVDIFAQPLPLETDFSKLDVNNPTVQQTVQGMQHNFINKGLNTEAALKSSYLSLDHMVTKQAAVLSYMDVFFYLGIIFLICTPFVLMVRSPLSPKGGT